jgi:hypothetical protein
MERMLKDYQFHIPATQIRLPGDANAVDMKLRLPGGETYSISGFPRLFTGRTHSKLGIDTYHNHHRLKTRTEKSKSEDTVLNRRPYWNPPSLERLALVDLGPLKSPLTSNASYRSIGGGRSSNSTNDTNHDKALPQVPELDIDHRPFGSDDPPSPISKPLTQNSPGRTQTTDKVSILQAVRDSEMEQRVAEREALRRLARKEAAESSRAYGTARTATPPRVILPLRTRKVSGVAKEDKRVSESSEDEIFGQIIASPTAPHLLR